MRVILVPGRTMSEDTCGHSRNCVWRAGRKLNMSPSVMCIGVGKDGDPCGARAMTSLALGDDEPMQPFCRFHLGLIATALEMKQLETARRKSDGPGFVYFVRRDNRVKIGFTIQPQKRFRALEMMGGSRFDDIVVRPGSRSVEGEYHRRFADHRETGEWFSVCDEILVEMDRLRPDDPFSLAS